MEKSRGGQKQNRIKLFETPIRVRYADTDTMGIVCYRNIYHIFEVERQSISVQKVVPPRI